MLQGICKVHFLRNKPMQNVFGAERHFSLYNSEISRWTWLTEVLAPSIIKI